MMKTILNRLKFRAPERDAEMNNDQLEAALKDYYDGKIDAAKIVSIASSSLGSTFEMTYLEEDRTNLEPVKAQPIK